MSKFLDLAAHIDLMGQRFHAAGLNAPRLVLSGGDYDALLAMIPPDVAAHYGREPVTIGAVKVVTPRR